MLKIILSLFGDWRAYRRALGAFDPHALRFWKGSGLGSVSVWPVELNPAPTGAGTF